MKEPRSILITGASSGIGEALAMAYAGPGVSLALTGRDADRLEKVAAACRGRSARVETALINVADADSMARWIEAIDRAAPIDLVVANAGRGAGSEEGPETAEVTRAVFAVNLGGLLNTVLPLIPRFQARRRGQIAVMSSLASFRGFPPAPAYCASKAAVRIWGEALRGHLHRYGIEVSVICPGFIVSRMTDKNKFPMPFLMDAARAAAIMKRGLERNRARIAFPFPLYFAIWLVSSLSPVFTDWLFTRLRKKK
jgi:short-subunit dehydrogenase